MTPSKYTWAVVIIAMFGSLTIMDMAMVSLAIAPLSREFDASIDQVQWVLTGNLLAVGVVIPSSGYLADRFGMKRAFLASLALFTISAAACGFAPDLNTLIVFRVSQGIGAGALRPLSTAMLFRVVPHQERGRFMGITMAPVMVGMALAPTISGALVEYVSWRWIFFLSVLIGAVPIVLALVWLREQKLPTSGRFDLPGLVLSAAGFALLLYALSKAPSRGWTDPLMIAILLASLVSLTGFVAVALRARFPIVDLRLFAQRGFALNNAAIWLFSLGLYGAVFLLPLFFQQVQGRGPMEAGLVMMPMGMAAGITVPIAGRVYDAHGARWITTAGVAMTAGVTAMFALWTIDTGAWIISPLLFARGIGVSMAITPGTAAVHEVRGNEMARASALLIASQQIASSLAVASMATILAERGPALRESAVRGLEPGSQEFAAASRDALMFTFHEVFLIVATVTILAIAVALMLRSGRPHIAEVERAPAAESAATEP